MNLALLSVPLAPLADIVISPPPPPPNLVAGPFAGNPLVSLVFWALAIVAAVGLWRLRRQRAAARDRSGVEPS